MVVGDLQRSGMKRSWLESPGNSICVGHLLKSVSLKLSQSSSVGGLVGGAFHPLPGYGEKIAMTENLDVSIGHVGDILIYFHDTLQ